MVNKLQEQMHGINFKGQIRLDDQELRFGKLRCDLWEAAPRQALSLGLRTLSTHFATYSTMLYVG
jgi:hypothetical protein